MAKEGVLALYQSYSIEKGSFNIVATCVMTEAGAKLMGFTKEMLEMFFFSLPGGGARSTGLTGVFWPEKNSLHTRRVWSSGTLM